jgi:hypothetical protein
MLYRPRRALDPHLRTPNPGFNPGFTPGICYICVLFNDFNDNSLFLKRRLNVEKVNIFQQCFKLKTKKEYRQ